MPMRIRCDCGHEIVVDETAALLAQARQHAMDAHQMEISAERILALAEVCEDDAERLGETAEQGKGGGAMDAKA
jgi:predicted small metal-binding protein